MPYDVTKEFCWDQRSSYNCRLQPGHHGIHKCTCGCHITWENKADTDPCISTEIAVLGVVGEPARLRCGLLVDHDGPHRFGMEWT